MPDAVHLTLFILRPTRTERWMRKLLSAFEEYPAFAPTHWSPKDQRSLPPYSAAGAVRGIVEDSLDLAQGVFKRNKEPKYEGLLIASNNELSTFKLKFDTIQKPQNYEALYSFASRVACLIEPEFGVLHPIWALGNKSQEYSESGLMRAMDVQKYGLRSFCARTWLGPRLGNLLGEKLTEAELKPKTLSKTVQEIDLLENPWLADFKSMSTRRKQVMNIMTTSGLFGVHSPLPQRKKAEKWEPFVPVQRRTKSIRPRSSGG